MTDYKKIGEDVHERFSESFHKLHVSELKDQLAEKDEIITALNHVIDEQQDKIDFLNRSHEILAGMLNKMEEKIERLRNEALEEAANVVKNRLIFKSCTCSFEAERAIRQQKDTK